MARLSFECQDKDGDRVTIQSSEWEFDEALRNYEGLKQLLANAGFTILKAGRSSGYTKNRGKQEKITFDGQTCPKCGAGVWDNRPKKESGEFNKKSPDFACRNKCGFAVWPGQYEIAE